MFLQRGWTGGWVICPSGRQACIGLGNCGRDAGSRPVITTVARMSFAKCGDQGKIQNPDIASLIRATLASRPFLIQLSNGHTGLNVVIAS
jgi:hypothetical protein